MNYKPFAALLLMLQAGSLSASDDQTAYPTLSDEELSRLRGGFSLQGLELNFGAEIRTYLDGKLVLQTNINWNQDGASRAEFVSDALSRPDAAQLHAGALSGGGINFSLSGQQVFLANDGQTALLHRTEGALQNILLNTASNVDARQEVDATLDLANAGSYLDLARDARLADSLGSAMAAGVPGMR